MRRRATLLLTITTLGCSPAPCQDPAKRDSAPPPNVVLVMSDDQGFGDAGYNGHPTLQTPNLDAMAAGGLRFDRFYAAAPVCSPTRGSCLTGRHPYRYGVVSANRGHLRPEESNLAEILQARGYATGHFGKWHLGTLTKEGRDSNRGGARNQAHYAPPWDHGFDTCFSTEAKVPTLDPMVTPPKFAGGVGKKEPGSPYGTSYWSGPGKRVTENLKGDDSRIIMDRVIPFVERAAEQKKRFFAVVWFHAPHLPVVADEEQLARYKDVADRKTRHYYGCITALDAQVGRLRTKLRELDVAKNTMVFFCSDNGPEGRTGRAPGTTGGLRGRKRSLYEGGVRVPGILEWPAEIAKGRRTSIPCCTSDFLPTVLAAIGARPKLPVDGVSLLPLIRGAMKKRPHGIGFQSAKQVAWIDNQYKLVRAGKGTGFELFDLVADPGEKKNLTEREPRILARMRRDLEAWRESCAKSAQGADYK